MARSLRPKSDGTGYRRGRHRRWRRSASGLRAGWIHRDEPGCRPTSTLNSPSYQSLHVCPDEGPWLNRIQAVGKGTVNEDLSVDYEWYEVR